MPKPAFAQHQRQRVPSQHISSNLCNKIWQNAAERNITIASASYTWSYFPTSFNHNHLSFIAANSCTHLAHGSVRSCAQLHAVMVRAPHTYTVRLLPQRSWCASKHCRPFLTLRHGAIKTGAVLLSHVATRILLCSHVFESTQGPHSAHTDKCVLRFRSCHRHRHSCRDHCDRRHQNASPRSVASHLTLR